MATQGQRVAESDIAHSQARPQTTSQAFADLVANFQREGVPTRGEPPHRDYVIPEEWRANDDSEAAFWRNVKEVSPRSLGFELEMSMARSMLATLLVQNRYLQGELICRWPSRDRHQLWATAWLALRFVNGHVYKNRKLGLTCGAEAVDEVNTLIEAHLGGPCASEAIRVAVRSELVRRGFLVPGGEPGLGADAPLVLSQSQVSFLLDGDKLFLLRAAVASRRPWWQLPLAAQFVAAPRAVSDGPPALARLFRCTLLSASTEGLGTSDATAHSAMPTAHFVPTGGGMPLDCRNVPGGIEEGAERFTVLQCEFDEPTTCTEVRVSSPTRLPPFRVEALIGASWELLACQPLPTGEEMLNQGRDATRCFLPRAAVATRGGPELHGLLQMVAERLLAGGIVGQEGGVAVLKRWPSKQKQQAAAVLWLALRLEPSTVYREHEIDWLIGQHYGRAHVPDCPTIRKEFERHGLVERCAGGGGIELLEEAVRRTLHSHGIDCGAVLAAPPKMLAPAEGMAATVSTSTDAALPPPPVPVPACRWRASVAMLRSSIQRATFEQDGQPLRWAEAIKLFAEDPEWAAFYSGVLAAAPFEQFYWECPPVTAARAAELPFEHVVVQAHRFAPADPNDFAEHFAGAAEALQAVSFANLGGDAHLIAPCERGPRSQYGHLAAFLRSASAEQQVSLWALVGEAMQGALRERGSRATWLSTEGSGVPWLHVRLDSRPKYYHHSTYQDFVH